MTSPAPLPRDGTSDRHLTVVPDPPAAPPAAEPAVRGVRPDLMWLAVVGPVGALGAFGLVSWWLAQAVGVGWTVALYALVVAAMVAARARWGR